MTEVEKWECAAALVETYGYSTRLREFLCEQIRNVPSGQYDRMKHWTEIAGYIDRLCADHDGGAVH